MIPRREIQTVYAAGAVQGLALVTFPAAAGLVAPARPGPDCACDYWCALQATVLTA